MLLLLVAGSRVGAQETLEVERYVEVVLRAHPAAAQVSGLELAARAEHSAARLFPDPTFEYTVDKAQPNGAAGPHKRESAYAVSQTIPWPGTYSAGKRAGDRAGDAFRASGESVRWRLAALARQAYARLAAARALLEIARGAEADARSLLDLVSRRAELGESRESDRIKARVEWLRQQRNTSAAEREAEASEANLRSLAVTPLPQAFAVDLPALEPVPPLDSEAIAAEIVSHNPSLQAARAEALRQEALLSAALRARIPDLDVTVFRQNELDKEATGIAVGVKVPLWNANRGEIARAEANGRIASAEAAQTCVDLTIEARTRLKDVQVAGGQAALLDSEILPAAKKGVELVRLTFEEGETSLLDLLDAQRTFRDTQREAVEARLAFSVALSELQRLAGPDFNPWR